MAKRNYEKPVLLDRGVLSKIVAQTVASGIDFTDPGAPGTSDSRLKTNISRVGTTVLGLPLYQFAYLGGDEMFTGVMAQDVLDVMPEAVIADATGFYRVNYAMLGIEMQRVH